LIKFGGRFKIVERKIAREERQMVKKVNRKVVKRGVKKAVSKVLDKALVGVLVLALVLAGAAGAYAFYLGEKLDASQKQQAAEISALHDEILAQGEKTQTGIDALDSELKSVTLEMEQSSINASKLYQEASQSVVWVSDGNNVLGSGFAFDVQGHILTPYHVIKGQNLVYIITADGHTSVAMIIGSSEYSDVAVLQGFLTSALAPPALTMADSSQVKVGEPVIVIGNPFDLPWTITSGIVSQTNRFAGVANIIQFDAAINIGNSGSPLLNAKGEVIGMVNARIDPQQGDGVYYAVSSNKAKKVALSLIERGSFDYPWLGVEITNVTPLTAIARNLETVNGALVKTVIAGTPAATAGVMVDDIIIAINGTQVKDMAGLTCYLGEYTSYGDKVTLTMIRGWTQIELPLTVGKR
jgi:2-alkenal reductase